MELSVYPSSRGGSRSVEMASDVAYLAIWSAFSNLFRKCQLKWKKVSLSLGWMILSGGWRWGDSSYTADRPKRNPQPGRSMWDTKCKCRSLASTWKQSIVGRHTSVSVSMLAYMDEWDDSSDTSGEKLMALCKNERENSKSCSQNQETTTESGIETTMDLKGVHWRWSAFRCTEDLVCLWKMRPGSIIFSQLDKVIKCKFNNTVETNF